MRWSIPKPYYYGSAILTTCGAAYLTKDYLSGGNYKGDEVLTDKIVIVTGANSGIGKETVRGLAARGAKVIMACRNIKECQQARINIITDTRNKNVFCRQCDLASQESIRKFVTRFKQENPKLHILINNAGVMNCPRSYTKEGIETQLGVNHMGHFLLTNLLLDVLKDSVPSRIVNISSVAHLKGTIDTTDLNSTKDYDNFKAYAQSKLANVLFTRELAERLKGTGVTVNAIHPGTVDTEIVRHMSYVNSFTKMLIKPFLWPFIKSPRQGAQTVIHAALDPSLADVSGCYFSDRKPGKISDEAKNDKLAKWLWLVSEKWTKLNTTTT